MSNFAADIREAADGEPIEAIVISPEGGWGDYGLEDMEPHPPKELTSVVLTWAEAEPWLDREYSTGYGSPSCWCITAWTKDQVIFVTQYDGSTSLCTVPRHPVAHDPSMPGG